MSASAWSVMTVGKLHMGARVVPGQSGFSGRSLALTTGKWRKPQAGPGFFNNKVCLDGCVLTSALLVSSRHASQASLQHLPRATLAFVPWFRIVETKPCRGHLQPGLDR